MKVGNCPITVCAIGVFFDYLLPRVSRIPRITQKEETLVINFFNISFGKRIFR
jgi:hypothetical protein